RWGWGNGADGLSCCYFCDEGVRVVDRVDDADVHAASAQGGVPHLLQTSNGLPRRLRLDEHDVSAENEDAVGDARCGGGELPAQAPGGLGSSHEPVLDRSFSASHSGLLQGSVAPVGVEVLDDRAGVVVQVE